jgi:predicted membrane protein
VALMGGIDLDLSKARLAPGEAELNLVAVMGVVTVHVPPEVRVECRGDAVSLTNQRRRPDTPLPTATTTIRITGRAIMGAVKVKLIDRETQ